MKKVIATVKSGSCNQGFHKVGDSWVIGELTPEIWAYYALSL